MFLPVEPKGTQDMTTMLVNEYVDTVARQERKDAAEARKAEQHIEQVTAADNGAETAGTSKGLVATALVLLNLLIVAAIGVNYAVSPILSWVLLVVFVLTNMYTVNQLKEMFGTYSIVNDQE